MKSTAHVYGHPIHPMLIPYPFALLTSAVGFDVASRMTGRNTWSRTAAHLTDAGLGCALAAALPGVIDYFGSLPAGSAARRTATRHALSNVSALLCFTLARASRQDDRHLPASGLALAILGTGLLSIGGWLGGQLVYHEGVGVAGHERPLLTKARGA
jgi:uncharacterized membrane protein